MKRKAIVYKDEASRVKLFPWSWVHHCRGESELVNGAPLSVSSLGHKTQESAFLAAWRHVEQCRGIRVYFDN